MQKIFELIKIAVIITVILCSCSLKHINKTGNYYVKNVSDSTCQFYFTKGGLPDKGFNLAKKERKD